VRIRTGETGDGCALSAAFQFRKQEEADDPQVSSAPPWLERGFAARRNAAWPQDGPIKAPTVRTMADHGRQGRYAWMLISSALVLMMSVPALALFYGGLVRTKNMLSVLMQVFMIVSSPRSSGSAGAIRWPSPAASPFVGGFDKAFLRASTHHLCRDLLEQRLSARICRLRHLPDDLSPASRRR
jgi:hypothetical protein